MKAVLIHQNGNTDEVRAHGDTQDDILQHLLDSYRYMDSVVSITFIEN